MSYWKQAKESLRHVLWIGGASTAGKSTIATRLADEFSLVHYSIDSHLNEHRSRATESEYPALHTATQAWVRSTLFRQPPGRIAELMRGISRDRLSMAVEDLLAMPGDRAIVADIYFGEVVEDLHKLIDPTKAIFLVPTLKFHKEEYQRRFRGHEGSKKTSFREAFEDCPDPEAAFMSGWVQFQLNYNQYLRQECKKHNLRLLITGGQTSLAESYKAVCDHFHLSSESQ